MAVFLKLNNNNNNNKDLYDYFKIQIHFFIILIARAYSNTFILMLVYKLSVELMLVKKQKTNNRLCQTADNIQYMV